MVLPKISENLEVRKAQISENIEAAEKQREESDKKLKEYGIVIDKINSERLVNSLIYLSFLISYSFMDY